MTRTTSDIISFPAPDDPKAERRIGNLPISPHGYPQTMSRSLRCFFFQLDRIYRFYFLFSVIMMAIYPAMDACWDCLCLTTSPNIAEYLNDPDDWVSTNELKLSSADDLKQNHQDLKKNDHMCRLVPRLVRKVSVRNELVCAKKVDFPITEKRFEQSYHPLSSDLSPPTA